MKVVVTGGAGFIGANLCRSLAADPRISDVVALDDLSTGKLSNLDGVEATFVEGSILDSDVLDRVLQSAQSVVHLAARPSVPRSVKDPMASHNANATGTVTVLESARRAAISHVVLASSSSVYGGNPHLPKHEDLAPRPLSPYAASKLAAEAYSLAYQNTFGIGVLAFRFFNVFGPLQDADHAYAAVIPAFVAAALSGNPLPVHGDGLQTRDFTFIETVAEVITEAVARRTTSDAPVNLAFGSRTDLLTVVSMLEDVLGRALTVDHREPRPGDVRDSQADQRRLRELFPDVHPVALLDGLRRTVAWFAQRQPAAS
jgi:UDP-glucose 4-epimerase